MTARRLLLPFLIVLLGASVSTAEAASTGRVVVRRTAHGIPHITAQTVTGLGLGYGYAFAQDNVCTMAEDYATVDAKRSRYFGPNGSYLQRGNGAQSTNLAADIFWQSVIDAGTVPRLVARKPPLGPLPDARAEIRGYVLGYNRYLRKVGGSRGVPDPTCRGKAWVHPITVATEWRRIYQLALQASGDVAIQGIAEATPPAGRVAPTTARASRHPGAQGLVRALRRYRTGRSTGSNAVAVGRAGAKDKTHGVLLGNPHFPWTGPERFYQAQLTVPGKVDVEGVSLYGVPSILIGHTKSLAWSHTVSTAYRFTPYELTLKPGSPTTYLVDGKPVAMTKHVVRVQARQRDGSLKTIAHTLYGTRWGPVFTTLLGFDLGWSRSTAYAIRDANAGDLRFINHFVRTDEAQSVPQLLKVLKTYQGLPWVNTIAADRAGHALYADIGTMPNVSNALAKRCDTALGAASFASMGLPILDGAKASCAWPTAQDSPGPGLMGWSRQPFLQRSDYVTNSNDSYWLANPAHPLEGFARIIGDERAPRKLRTRIGLIMVKAAIRAGGLDRASIERLDLRNRDYAGELTRAALVRMCRGFSGGMAPSTNGPVAVGTACDVLARWDLHDNAASQGAILFRRFFDHAFGDDFFTTPFNAKDPVNTPNTLNVGAAPVQAALGDAITDLRRLRLPLDVSVGTVQYVMHDGKKVPIHGGPGDPNGSFNAINTSFDPKTGFTKPEDGSSYIQAVTWTKRACPDVGTILTYSESANPRSPFFSDQAPLFAKKQWVREAFCAAAVKQDTRSTLVLAR